MNKRITIGSDAVGYIFRTDCADKGWSYIGQSTRLDRDHLDSYYGSGFFIKEALTEHGSGGLEKHVLATATSELTLHYLEMLHIAETRVAGIMLLNGDFGGPRPFQTFQRFLWEEAPEAMMAWPDFESFHRVISNHRSQVEVAIERTMAIRPDEFYLGYERELIAVMDLSHPCPTCGSPTGAVCRTNTTNAEFTTKQQNPTKNHKKRPRRTVE